MQCMIVKLHILVLPSNRGPRLEVARVSKRASALEYVVRSLRLPRALAGKLVLSRTDTHEMNQGSGFGLLHRLFGKQAGAFHKTATV